MVNTLCSTDTYSVVIRTIGKGGENYKRLLESIKKQTLQPEHIFVVLPYDYALPPEQISTEEFVFTEKGMWNQRIFGLKYADTHSNSRYYLVVDDDVEFGKDFVRKAMARMTENDIALLAPQSVKPDWQVPSPVKRFSFSNLCNVLLGRRFESRRPNIRTHIAATGGFFQNTAHAEDLVPTESGNFQAFFMRREIAKDINFDDESWLDDSRYALPDDMVFFYKTYLNGYKTMHDRSLHFVHLGEVVSTPARKVNSAYAQGRNFIIFWHRFLYSLATTRRRRLMCKAAISYRIISNAIAYTGISIYSQKSAIIKSYLKGVKDALNYLKTTAYRNKPSAIASK